MLNILLKGAPAPISVQPSAGWAAPAGAIWFDFVNPTREEELAVEAALGFCLPTREDMSEIETSSRLYREDKAIFMTAQLLVDSQGDAPALDPGAFVLSGDRLITIRYVKPTAFSMVYDQIAREPLIHPSGPAIFIALVDAIVDRLADAVERASVVTEGLSERIFATEGKRDFRILVHKLGALQRLNGKIRESAASFTRLIIFCEAARELKRVDGHEQLEVQHRDIASIIDHAGSLSGNITFLLDAALGMINIEQNAIIKIFSIGAVVLLPPTLIASYFGMNFEHMPIFGWPWGEPAAAAGMLISVVIALWLFRRKGWF